LAQEDGKGNGKSVAVSWDQDLFPRHAFGQVKFFLDGGSDVCDFLQDFWAIDLFPAHVSERVGCFFVSTLLDQPSGRFLQENQSNEEQASGNELDSNLRVDGSALFWQGGWSRSSEIIRTGIRHCEVDGLMCRDTP
jgi:hypothetical protein